MSSHNKFQLRCSCMNCKKETTVQSLSSHIKKCTKVNPSKTCPRCLKQHTKNTTFCSLSCANKRSLSEETKIKISKTLSGRANPIKGKKLKHKFTSVRQCKVCNRWFSGRAKTCSSSCLHTVLSLAGRKSVALQGKRSKDEIKLYELCSSIFKNVTHNEPIFNGWDADIIIHDFKIAVLWNGPWHYREMNISNHSLRQVQNRDQLKIDAIKSMNWQILIFEDRHYSPETAFEIVKLRALELHQDYALDVFGL